MDWLRASWSTILIPASPIHTRGSMVPVSRSPHRYSSVSTVSSVRRGLAPVDLHMLGSFLGWGITSMAQLIPSKQPLVIGSLGLGLGILFVFSPPCFTASNRLNRLVRLSECLLALGSFAVSGYNFRLVKLRYAEIWKAQQEGEVTAQLLDLNDRILANCSVTALPAEKQEGEPPTGNYQPSSQQLERLFYEGSDEVRNWLRENGFFHPEKSPKMPSDKGFGDSKQPESSGNTGNNQLADSAPSASPSSPLPGWGEEKLRDGTKWNYPEAARRVCYLVAQGMELERAIAFLTGATSGTVYQGLLAAYRKLVE